MLPRILVIEDELRWREQFKDILEDMGFEVDAVEGIKDAEASLRTSEYVLVLLDAALDQPHFNLACQQFCDSLRRRYPDLPVVATTGKLLEPPEVFILARLGIVGFLYKPRIDLQGFKQCIQAALKQTTEIVAPLAQTTKMVVQVAILLEGDSQEFTADKRDSFVSTLSRIVNATPDQIHVLHIEPGSVLVTLEMPEHAAQALVSMYLASDPTLRTLHIRKVEIRQLALAQTYAVLIGIAAYHHLRSLSKTTTDAHDLHDLLAQNGYPTANLALLLDEQATKAAISDKLDWLARYAGPDDTVVIFFSGHGAQRIGGFEPGEYLCPVEADWYNLRATAISDEELTTALRAIRAGRVAVFLDACHSGGVGEPKDAALQVKAGLSEAAYARLAAGRGRAVIASCRPDEVSWELAGLRNGLFTHYLLDGLRGAAADPDGAVDILDLFKHVSRQVPQHEPQHPLFKGEIEVNFPITTSVKPSAIPAPPTPTPGESTVPLPAEIAPDSVDPKKLRLAMHTAYDRSTFEVLCKDLGLDYHDLRGETLETKMLYLIDWHQRRRQYARLVRKVLEDHPYLAQELR